MNSIVFIETLTLSSEVVEEAVGIVLDSARQDQADVCAPRMWFTNRNHCNRALRHMFYTEAAGAVGTVFLTLLWKSQRDIAPQR